MDDQDLMHRKLESSRPSLGFPLGTALLLIVIFCISGVFSCCYHWDKLRSLRRTSTSSAAPADMDTATATTLSPPSKPSALYQSSKQNQNQSLPVLMPGDVIPKFIALPCPCERSPPASITVQVQMPPLVH